MISVSRAGPDRLCICLTKDETSEVRNILESLLSVRFNPKTGAYFMPTHDFPIFKEKMDRIGRSTRREMDDAAWEMIGSYEANLELNERIKAGEYNQEIEPLLAANLKSQLWPDQVSDVRFCLRHARAGIFSEMGTGKSLIILATYAMLKLAGLAKYALVIVPNGVKQGWLRQIKQHTNLTAMELGNGRRSLLRNLKEYGEKRTDVVITHYEALRDQDVRAAIVAFPFDIVCVDEAHLIKNESGRAKSLADTVSKIQPVVPLVEVELETPDGVLTRAVLPTGAKPGDVVDFW